MYLFSFYCIKMDAWKTKWYIAKRQTTGETIFEFFSVNIWIWVVKQVVLDKHMLELWVSVNVQFCDISFKND